MGGRPLNSGVRRRDVLPAPSRLTASLGGMWSALGFVPFDIWLGENSHQSPQLLGLLWWVVGIVFLWAPYRFLIAGTSIESMLRTSGARHGSRPMLMQVIGRAAIWVLSCAITGVAISTVLLLLGYNEHHG